jgi:hypothetical protein
MDNQLTSNTYKSAYSSNMVKLEKMMEFDLLHPNWHQIHQHLDIVGHPTGILQWELVVITEDFRE